LHYADIPDEDTEIRHGVRITRPLRTILDLLFGGNVPASTLRNALREGLQRGLIRRSEISGAEQKLRDDKNTLRFLRNATV